MQATAAVVAIAVEDVMVRLEEEDSSEVRRRMPVEALGKHDGRPSRVAADSLPYRLMSPAHRPAALSPTPLSTTRSIRRGHEPPISSPKLPNTLP